MFVGEFADLAGFSYLGGEGDPESSCLISQRGDEEITGPRERLLLNSLKDHDEALYPHGKTYTGNIRPA